MNKVILSIAAVATFPLLFLAQGKKQEWSAYGGNPEQTRYSSLKQINRTNVSQLAVAWTYDTGETGGLQTQPIIVDGVLYAYTPTHKTFALEADTGKHLWTFDSKIAGRGPNRGVMYWAAGSDKRVFAAVDQYVYALDARNGTPISTFGNNGRIDLRLDLGRDPQGQSVRLTSPGVVYKDTFIIGGRVGEGVPSSPGYIRAYDARTGKLRWTFHTIPHPGEAGYETWSKDSWTINGGANNWAGMALDERRGIVYVPTGSAAADFYGANRMGDNLFANSLIALNAETGKRLWHFQVVRHDLWDRDLPSPPSLVTLRQNGQTIDAVAQTTKHGFVFVFDRTTGKPVFPVEYRKFPASDMPREIAADIQPVPIKPKPFARQLLTEDMLTTRTPEAHAWAIEAFRKLRSAGQFVPLAAGKETVIFPGFDGGAEWGGSAVDSETGLLYVNANDLAWTGALAPNDAGGYRFTGYTRFLDPERYPAIVPPWGTLSAINLNTGEYAWQIPLGEYPELAQTGIRNTGTENYGGPIVTAGGLVFIAATNFDKKFRAFDKANGQLLWETTLPFAGNATPATFEADGRQFVVIAAGGGQARRAPSGGVYVAFALPRGAEKKDE
ncbi:MAG TPA: pyrroloquinoline quinone-dependent dehydrogenase [Terriglobia bacterium]|nr:pyrroloquinoline quinone-dependent dehydrogenase [Terriglobia bacterium]